jgi:hypothetical protein
VNKTALAFRSSFPTLAADKFPLSGMKSDPRLLKTVILRGAEMSDRTNRQIGPSVQLVLTSHVTRTLLARFLPIVAIPILLGSLLQACGGSSGGPAPSNIESITIDPVSPSVAHGTNIQLHATANLKNKTTKNITESSTWVSGGNW